MTALSIPVSEPRPGKVLPRLRAVPRKRGSVAPFIVTLAVIFGLGMAGQLALTTALQGQAFAIDAQQAQAQTLANQLVDLQAKVTQVSSTPSLAVKAEGLGMVPNPYPVQLRLSDGTVRGTPTAVTGAEVGLDTYKTPARQAGTGSANAGAPAAQPAQPNKKANAQ